MKIRALDNFLNNTTMYRLVTYYLSTAILLAIILSILNILPYSAISITLSTIYLILISLIINEICARVLKSSAHHESSIITALILALVIGPQSPLLFEHILLLTAVGFVAQISKYVLVWNRKHLLNPVAFSMVFAAVVLGSGASWWVGSVWMNTFIVLGGIVLLRKIGRLSIVIPFTVVYLTLLILLNDTGSIAESTTFITSVLIANPILFFILVMLTEPQTSPQSTRARVMYGSFTAIILITYQTYTDISFGLELALLTGNIFAFAIEPSKRVVMSLATTPKRIAKQTYEFIFKSNQPLRFTPGQYMEWTLPHKKQDSRGSRRYFTISSSPTDENISITVKIPEKKSSFKRALRKVKKGQKIYANGPAGEFILPSKLDEKLLFIAGGVGVTPFISMIKYLLERGERRDIVLLYITQSPDSFAYEKLFKKAENDIGVRTQYVVNNLSHPISPHWRGDRAILSQNLLEKEVPDLHTRAVYISGPPKMVSSAKKILRSSGVFRPRIKTDLFTDYSEL